MRTIELEGEVDNRHQLSVQVPSDVPPGKVKLHLIVPSNGEAKAEEDDAGKAWARGVAAEWAEDLADTRQDIYTLKDGEPVDESR